MPVFALLLAAACAAAVSSFDFDFDTAGQCAFCGLEHDWETNSAFVEDALKTATFQIGFHFESDGGYPWNGSYVDDVRLSLSP